MDKRVLTVVIVAVLAIGGGITYFVTRPAADTPEQETADQEKADEQPRVIVDDGLTGGKYIDYEEGIIAKTSGTKFLFFHSAGNTQSLALDADIRKQDIPKSVTIIKVDYETNQPLREQYGVTAPATVVKVYDNGQIVKAFAAQDNPTLSAVLGYLF